MIVWVYKYEFFLNGEMGKSFQTFHMKKLKLKLVQLHNYFFYTLMIMYELINLISKKTYTVLRVLLVVCLEALFQTQSKAF